MAKPKFPLRMDDGSEARTLEELREHADLATIAARYDDGTLRRWLGCWNFIEETEKVGQLDSEAEGFHKALYDVLGIPWTEETDAQLAAYADAEIERELAAQKEQKVQEVQAEPEEEIPEPGNALARPSMDDAMCDEVARLLNYRSDEFEFVETDDYIFLSSDSSGKDEKWTIISKKDGRDMNFMPLEEDEERLPSARCSRGFTFFFSKAFREFNRLFSGAELMYRGMRAYENKVVFTDGRYSISTLDLEEWRVKEIVSWNEYTRNWLATDVVNNRIVYAIDVGESDGSLWLCNLKDGTSVQITAGGQPIKAKNAVLTEDTLFFVCENSKGQLNDGKDPNGCLCRYDLYTGKSRVLAHLKIRDFKLWHIGVSGNRLHICGSGDEENYYCDISTDELTGTVRFKCLSEDLRAGHHIEHGEKFCTKGLFAFQDGFVFLCGSERKLYLCFLDFATGGKRFFPLADTAERVSRIGASTWFRLGNWLYYDLEKNETSNMPRERWKISLETGEQVKLSCGD